MMAPGAPPFGGPPQGLESLQQLLQQPSPDAEQSALSQATMQLGGVLPRVHLRSPRAAKLIADAISRLESARDALTEDMTEALAPPPDLLGGLTPNRSGLPSMGPY